MQKREGGVLETRQIPRVGFSEDKGGYRGACQARWKYRVIDVGLISISVSRLAGRTCQSADIPRLLVVSRAIPYTVALFETVQPFYFFDNLDKMRKNSFGVERVNILNI